MTDEREAGVGKLRWFWDESAKTAYAYVDSVQILSITSAGGMVGSMAGLTLPSQAQGAIMRGASASQWEVVDASTSGQILVGDGSDVVSVAVSGDVSLVSSGAVTVADPTKVRSATVNLNNDGTGVDGAIVGTAADSLGHAAGVQLVAAVASKIIEPVAVSLSFTFDTAAYTGGGNVSAIYSGGVDATGVAGASASIGDTANNINVLRPLSGLALVNTDLRLVAASAFTDPGTAAGTLAATTYYRLIDA